MLKIISILITFFAITHAHATTAPPASAAIDSWLVFLILGLGLPALALFIDKRNKK